jgi:hypothetical protein
VRDLPLLKTPEGTILVPQRSGIRGMSAEQTGFRALIEPVSGDVHSRQNAAEDRD